MYQFVILLAMPQTPLLTKPLENGINYKLRLTRTFFSKIGIVPRKYFDKKDYAEQANWGF